MIIACDVDNILNNLQEVVTNLFNKRYGTNYKMDDFTEYNIENVLPLQEAITMKEIYGESGLYKTIKPLSGAQDGLQKLVDADHQVYLVTDAIPKTYGEKVEWLNHFFPFVDNSHIIAMKHKHLLKCDVMIEDNLHTLLSGVSYTRVCLDYPWNRYAHDWAYGVYRCATWSEIVDVIHKINETEWC